MSIWQDILFSYLVWHYFLITQSGISAVSKLLRCSADSWKLAWITLRDFREHWASIWREAIQ